MKAVILAAGMGTRLRPETEHTPKCLLEIHGTKVIDYQLRALAKNGITDIAIVTGYMGEKIKEYIAKKNVNITFFENLAYAETQNAYSLWLTKDFLLDDTDGFIIINSDLIFNPELMAHLINHKSHDGMIVDRTTDMESDMVKVLMDGEHIKDMSKVLPAEKTEAEAVGPVKFSHSGGKQYLEYIGSFIEKGDRGNWLFYTLSDYSKEHDFFGIENPGEPWAEIDTVEDLKIAHERIPENFIGE